MSLGKYILSMILLTILCWLVWGIVLFKVNPFSGGFLGIFFFYLTLLFALTTTFSVVGLVLRRWFIRHDLEVKQVATALRQGVLFAVLIIGCLLLLHFEILTWWIALLFIALLTVIEFFLLSSSQFES